MGGFTLPLRKIRWDCYTPLDFQTPKTLYTIFDKGLNPPDNLFMSTKTKSRKTQKISGSYLADQKFFNERLAAIAVFSQKGDNITSSVLCH